jgi:hypothetical protein
MITSYFGCRQIFAYPMRNYPEMPKDLVKEDLHKESSPGGELR